MCQKIAKHAAKDVQSLLSSLGHKIPLGHAYELISKLQHQDSWNVLSALLKNKAAPEEAAPVPGLVPASGPMSDQQYVAFGVGKCPVCGNDQLEGDSIDIEGNLAFQKMFCHECESSWVDRYKLDGYEELEEGISSTVEPEEKEVGSPSSLSDIEPERAI